MKCDTIIRAFLRHGKVGWENGSHFLKLSDERKITMTELRHDNVGSFRNLIGEDWVGTMRFGGNEVMKAYYLSETVQGNKDRMDKDLVMLHLMFDVSV